MQLLLFNNHIQFRDNSLQPADICISRSIDICCMCMAASSPWGKWGDLYWQQLPSGCTVDVNAKHMQHNLLTLLLSYKSMSANTAGQHESVFIHFITLWLHLLFLRRAMFHICFQEHLHTHQNREGERYEATSEKQKMKYFVIWPVPQGGEPWNVFLFLKMTALIRLQCRECYCQTTCWLLFRSSVFYSCE